MDASLRSLTHRMYLRMFSRYLPTLPASILDVGCGTGSDLDALSRVCPECWGIDYGEVIESVKVQRPHLHLQASDMRSVRLGRTFDVIMCMGSGFMYARSKEDVAKVLDTFVAHAHIGTLLVLDALNAAGLSGMGDVLMGSFDRRRQSFAKHREWDIPKRTPVEDCCRYKSFFPDELKHLLGDRGFQVVGMFDNMEMKNTNLSGLKLYVDSIMSL